MTDPMHYTSYFTNENDEGPVPPPKIEEGVKLVPELKAELHRKKDLEQGSVIILDFKTTETIISALTAAGEMAAAPASPVGEDVALSKALEALTMIAEADPIWNGGVAKRNADQWRELYSELKTIASDTLAAIGRT